MDYPAEKITELEKKAQKIRCSIVTMLGEACSGHPGGSLSSTDIITALYFSVLRHDPKNPSWPERDRFHLSKGHCCPTLYATLAECGYFPVSKLSQLRKLGSMLQGHPDRRTPGIEVSSGSLGQGLSIAVGMALAGRIDKKGYRVYCLMGDGEQQEGNIWEAAMAAAHYKLDSLCGIVDCNGLQIDGKVCDVMNVEPVAPKYQAFGWHAIEVDGHNMGQLLAAFDEAKTVKGKPTVIVAHTIKGKGVSFMENVCNFHGVAPTKEEVVKALKELGA
ncbi:MAG: transketolase [Deltaproteobacteria bacterium]